MRSARWNSSSHGAGKSGSDGFCGVSFLGSTVFYFCNLRMPEGGSVDSFLLTALLGFFLSNILTLILLAVYFVAHEKQQDKNDQHL